MASEHRGPVGPSGTSNIQQSASSGPTQPPPQPDVDPIVRFKLLIPRLKESLVNLMKVSGQSLHQGSLVEEAQITGDGQQKFEKALEEFYSLCDQVEINLRLALESSQQTADLTKFLPFTVNIPNEEGKLPTQGNVLQYSQYMAIVKQQINCAKEIHDMLIQCSQKISEKRLM